MTDTWTIDNDDKSDHENCDQQEIESYLYSLVHHGSLVGEGEGNQGSDGSQPIDDDGLPAATKTWRYFNSPVPRDKGDTFRTHFDRQRKQDYSYNSPSNGPKLKSSFIWRRRFPVLLSNRTTTMEDPKTKGNESLTNVTRSKSPDVSKNTDSQSKECTIVVTDSQSNKDNTGEVNSNISDKVPTQNEDQTKDDLNNTLSSFDDFELPRPKKSTLNESMTQVLQGMLDDDASRSSLDNSDKRPKGSSKSGGGSGWTVGMSWEDMSSKFRFNFEVDSVCGDSVREGSVSASSRANTPEGTAPSSPTPISAEDVSKYNVSLKNKRDPDITTVEVPMELESPDSEAESIVEVVKPVKEPPPVVEISSDTEDIPTKKMSLDVQPMDIEEIEEDIVIVYETGVCKSMSTVENPPVTIVASASGKKRDKQRKRTRQSKSPGVDSQSRAANELQDVLSKMSDEPGLWRLCREDIVPRPSPRKYRPCDNCKQRDHNTWHCPDPVKIKVCSMCAAPGHTHFRCPERMCLNCGSQAASFVRRCNLCTSKKAVCKICAWTGHPFQQCPDLWRRYYMTITDGFPVAPPPNLEARPMSEMWCCNCAKRGHISDDCAMPTSPINEKRLSHVVSYSDPVKGEIGRNNRLLANALFALRDEASPVTQPNAAGSPSNHNPPKGMNRSRLLTDYYNAPEFKRNYRKIRLKIDCVAGFPVKPAMLADFLEQHLERVKNPPLDATEVQSHYLKLVDLMLQLKFKKGSVRKASLYATELNMTLLGYAGLGDGNDLVKELKKRIEKLRKDKCTRVPMKDRLLLNKTFSQLFKGNIRKDLPVLVSEYLKRGIRKSS